MTTGGSTPPPSASAAAAFDPALRVPVPGDGAGRGAWDAVPVVDRVPILFPDPAAYLASAGELATAPLDALPYEAMCLLARYLPVWAHRDAPLNAALDELLAAHAPEGAALGVDAGCGVGPHLRSLRHHCDRAVGVDGHIAALRAARTLCDGRAIDVPVRLEGRRFAWSTPVSGPPLTGVTLACGDMLDPPLLPGVADVVVALNLIDNVREPLVLLQQLDAILAPGGLLILSSPFAWSDDLTEPAQQLGGGTIPALAHLGSEAALRALLSGDTPVLPYLSYALLDEREAPWRLRNHARAESIYQVWMLAARKRA